MKIGIIGIGKLGLAFGLNLEMAGHDVFGVDKNVEYVDLLKSGTFLSLEPGINDALAQATKFHFRSDLNSVLECEVIFVVVATPSTIDFKYDHSAIDSLLVELKTFGRREKRIDLVINCTTFPGYCESITEQLAALNFHLS